MFDLNDVMILMVLLSIIGTTIYLLRLALVPTSFPLQPSQRVVDNRKYITKEVDVDLETARVKVILDGGFDFTKEFEGRFFDYGYNTIKDGKANLNIKKASELAREFMETPWNAGAGPIMLDDVAHHIRVYTITLLSVKPNVIKKVVQLEVLD